MFLPLLDDRNQFCGSVVWIKDGREMKAIEFKNKNDADFRFNTSERASSDYFFGHDNQYLVLEAQLTCLFQENYKNLEVDGHFSVLERQIQLVAKMVRFDYGQTG